MTFRRKDGKPCAEARPFPIKTYVFVRLAADGRWAAARVETFGRLDHDGPRRRAAELGADRILMDGREWRAASGMTPI